MDLCGPYTRGHDIHRRRSWWSRPVMEALPGHEEIGMMRMRHIMDDGTSMHLSTPGLHVPPDP